MEILVLAIPRVLMVLKVIGGINGVLAILRVLMVLKVIGENIGFSNT